ncbi:MAG: hypothetical protein CMJ58_27595 [Planctomycetaceae bacterium]|nr:hypothetical protein [Planctomycetaceae bacterium]
MAGAVAFNVMLWPILVVVLVRLISAGVVSADDWTALLFLAPLVLMGLGMIAVAIRRWRRARRFQDAVFRMVRTPASLGQSLSGVIHAPPGIPAITGIHNRQVTNQEPVACPNSPSLSRRRASPMPPASSFS